MRVMALDKPAPIERKPLVSVERPAPEPAEGEIQVRVEVCGVCRTDLHVGESCRILRMGNDWRSVELPVPVRLGMVRRALGIEPYEWPPSHPSV